MSFGRAPNNDTIAANHVNSEAAAWHTIRMTKFFKSRGQNAAPISGPPSRHLWNNFLHETRGPYPGPESHEERQIRLAHEWHILSLEQRRSYATAGGGADSFDDVDASKISAATLFRSGCGLSLCLEIVGDSILQRF